MGNYLTAPNTEKYVQSGKTEKMRYSVCAMQGWRVSMEDAHVSHIFKTSLSFNKISHGSCQPVALFGVYDGHGGSQVAQFVSRHILHELTRTPEFRAGHFDIAFKMAYITLDQLLVLPQGQVELENLAQNVNSNTPSTNVKPWYSETPPVSSRQMNNTTGLTYNHPSVRGALSPFKHRGFRSSVKLGSKKLYKHVGNTRQKTFTKNSMPLNDQDHSLSFESIGISEEYPVSTSVASRGNETHHTRGSKLRRRREAVMKKVDQLCATPESPQDNPDSFDPSLVYRQNKQSSSSTERPTEVQTIHPSSASNYLKDSMCPSISTTTTTPSNASSLFSFQTLKSLLSTIVRVGFTMGRHGATGNNSFASFTGCTALSVLITTTQIVVANAGDSRCVLCRGDIAVELSKDHKPGLAEERSRIYAAGGWLEMGRINGNLNLSRAIGDLIYKSNPSLSPDRQVVSAVPDVLTIDVTEQDSFLILGCDGIWESATSQDIVNFIRERINKVDNLEEILEALFEELLSPNPTLLECGCDNMTAILVDLQPNTRPVSAQRKKSVPIPRQAPQA